MTFGPITTKNSAVNCFSEQTKKSVYLAPTNQRSTLNNEKRVTLIWHWGWRRTQETALQDILTGITWSLYWWPKRNARKTYDFGKQMRSDWDYKIILTLSKLYMGTIHNILHTDRTETWSSNRSDTEIGTWFEDDNIRKMQNGKMIQSRVMNLCLACWRDPYLIIGFCSSGWV